MSRTADELHPIRAAFFCPPPLSSSRGERGQEEHVHTESIRGVLCVNVLTINVMETFRRFNPDAAGASEATIRIRAPLRL